MVPIGVCARQLRPGRCFARSLGTPCPALAARGPTAALHAIQSIGSVRCGRCRALQPHLGQPSSVRSKCYGGGSLQGVKQGKRQVVQRGRYARAQGGSAGAAADVGGESHLRTSGPLTTCTIRSGPQPYAAAAPGVSDTFCGSIWSSTAAARRSSRALAHCRPAPQVPPHVSD